MHFSRRSALKAAAALAAGPFILTGRARAAETYKVKHGRIHQSVVPWCFKLTPSLLSATKVLIAT